MIYKIFFIYNSKNYGNTLKEITNSIISKKKMNNNSKKNNTINIEPLNSAFFVINNYDKIRKSKGNQGKDIFFDDVPKKYQYLIISKNPINNAINYEIVINREYSKKKSNINNFNDSNNKNKKNKKRNKSKMKNRVSKYFQKNMINYDN